MMNKPKNFKAPGARLEFKINKVVVNTKKG